MNERMHQILDSLRRQIGEESWDAFFEAMYDAFGNYDQLEGENAVLFEQHNKVLRERIRELAIENTKLRELIERLQPTDSDGNVLDIADTVHMLRSEYDGDHEWDDVIVELALTKWGGDRWIVRGSKGEAWACDCSKIGYDEDAYEASDDAEPLDSPTLMEVENAKLRKECSELLRMAESNDPDFLHWPEIHDELRKLGVKIVKL